MCCIREDRRGSCDGWTHDDHHHHDCCVVWRHEVQHRPRQKIGAVAAHKRVIINVCGWLNWFLIYATVRMCTEKSMYIYIYMCIYTKKDTRTHREMFSKFYSIKPKSDCIYHFPNQSENGKYNLISTWFKLIRFQKDFSVFEVCTFSETVYLVYIFVYIYIYTYYIFSSIFLYLAKQFI